jgi:hypothetical protein
MARAGPAGIVLDVSRRRDRREDMRAQTGAAMGPRATATASIEAVALAAASGERR